ncbi:hypothetical protein DEJ02_14180 [Curtobacterium sp. MCLR17_042]|nr:hypothetical protein DEJ02_14180 [Curtobacterium sp. MCLR17_042]
MSNSFAITGAHVVPVSAPAFDGGAGRARGGRRRAGEIPIPGVERPGGSTVAGWHTGATPGPRTNAASDRGGAPSAGAVTTGW